MYKTIIPTLLSVFPLAAQANGNCMPAAISLLYYKFNFQEEPIAYIPTFDSNGHQLDFMLLDTPEGAVGRQGQASDDTWTLLNFFENKAGLEMSCFVAGGKGLEIFSNPDFSIAVSNDSSNFTPHYVRNAWAMVSDQVVYSFETNVEGFARIVSQTPKSETVIAYGGSFTWSNAVLDRFDRIEHDVFTADSDIEMSSDRGEEEKEKPAGQNLPAGVTVFPELQLQ